jgi:hypothetical protein
MITIFGEKLAFFSKTNVLIKFFHNLAFLSLKRQFFRRFFWQKYLKINHIGSSKAILQTELCTKFCACGRVKDKQGDQIGLIFAESVNVYCERFV